MFQSLGGISRKWIEVAVKKVVRGGISSVSMSFFHSLGCISILEDIRGSHLSVESMPFFHSLSGALAFTG